MDRKQIAYGVAFSLLGICSYAPAHASSMTADFFTLSSSNPDVEEDIPGVTTGLVENSLGPNGLPVLSPTDHTTYSPGSSNYINDINPVTGEILWWTPSSTVTADAQNVIVNLPYDQVLYPNGTGVPNAFGSDGGSNGYTSAILSGTFNLASPGTITMSLGSDDDAWVFVNGNLVDDNGGVHGFSDVPFDVSTGLNAGINTVDVFFADRHTTGSQLAFDADVTISPTSVPEPSSLPMLLAGLGLIGGSVYFGRRKPKATA